jgi:small subunit ribosomal protein S17
MSNIEKIGIVISQNNNKTLIVLVQTYLSHTKYQKIIIKKKHYFVHDENNICNIGDIILFKLVAPISMEF